MEPESRFVRANGLDLHYLDWGGDGPPAILLHATGFLAGLWEPMALELRRRYRVLALDQRGHGDSDKPPTGYQRLDFVADLWDFLQGLNLRQVVGIGHSAGAATLACCEALHRGTLSRAVLIEPIVFPPWLRAVGGDRPQRLVESALKRRTVWPSHQELFDSYRRRPPFNTWQREVLWAYVVHGTRQRHDGQVELKCPGAIEAQMYAGGQPFEAFELLPKVACPALVVRGEHSESHLPPVAQAIADQMPQARVVTIAGASHFAPMEKPEAVLAEIWPFLSDD